MRFKTREVAELYENLKGWSHPEFPFRDPEYSPGSFAPATDMTPFFAAWMAAKNLNAMKELWSFIAPDSGASKNIFDKGLGYPLRASVGISEWQLHELRAIYLLSLRTALVNGPQDAPFVARHLAACSTSCERLTIDADGMEDLVKATKPEILPASPYDVKRGPAGAAKFSVEKLTADTAAFEPVIARLKLMPPMSRLVLHDYVTRGWAQGRLRLSLYYGERMYGCSSGWNRHYLDWADFFAPPSDADEVPAAVTKDILKAALEQNGIVFKKSESRAALVEKARSLTGLVSALALQYFPEQRTLRPEWVEPVKAWSDRVSAVSAASAALVKLFAPHKRLK